MKYLLTYYKLQTSVLWDNHGDAGHWPPSSGAASRYAKRRGLLTKAGETLTRTTGRTSVVVTMMSALLAGVRPRRMWPCTPAGELSIELPPLDATARHQRAVTG